MPPVGVGTASVLDDDDERTRRAAAQVVRSLVDAGGRLIDTASSYGDAEHVLGEVMATAGLRDKVFIATKLEEPDKTEVDRSLTRLKTAKVDLLQLHNVRDPRQSLAQFKGGRLRATTGVSWRSKPCLRARRRISCRSIIHSMTAKRKNAFCRWRPTSKPPC